MNFPSIREYEKKTYQRYLLNELVSSFKEVFIGFQIASKTNVRYEKLQNGE